MEVSKDHPRFLAEKLVKMGDLELVTTLKDLPFRVQSASVKERKDVIENLIQVLNNPGVSESILKGICRVIHFTLPRYQDRASQLLVQNLIVVILEKHLEKGVIALTCTLSEIAQQQKNVVVTTNTCRSGLRALHWSCLLFVVGSRVHPESVNSNLLEIIDTQALLLTSVVAAGNQKRSAKAFNLLCNSWNVVPESDLLYLEGLKEIEQSAHAVVLASYVFKRLNTVEKNPSLKIEDYLSYFTDAFIKHFISCKTKPCPNVITSCYSLLNLITDEIFTKSVLPSLQKSMLRNPEVIIECVGLVLGGLKLDLSAFALEIGTSLIANLYSKDEQARKEAADACENLSAKITTAQSIELLLEKIFQVFHGSQGKLTTVEHKLSVLEGAGNLSKNSIRDSIEIEALTTIVIEHFLKVLKVEVHEKTLCFALEMLSLWGVAFPERKNVPKILTDGFSTTAGLKTCTPLVKTGYIKCLLAFLKRGSIIEDSNLTQTLLKSVEKAAAQPGQVLLVTEGLLSSVLLLKMNFTKENNGLNVLFDMDKQIFVSDKFLSLANDDVLLHVIQLCEILLLNHREKLNGKVSQLHRAILSCCLNSSNTKIRRDCLMMLRNMVGKPDGLSLACSLLAELNTLLQEIDSNCENNAQQLSSHSLIECITSICSDRTSRNDDQLEVLALNALLPASNQKVREISPNLWQKIVKFLNLNPKQVISRNFGHFKPIHDVLIENYSKSTTNENALSTLVAINADAVLPTVVDRVCDLLKNPKICQVTKDDYFTFLTPDGELYDKSVLPGEELNDAFNLKRESKVYSYKDQLEELQLRRELEEKKRKDGKIKQPKYTPKQLEAIKSQKMKEESIKTRLSELNSIISSCVSMIAALADGNPVKLSLYFKKLLPEVVKNLQSPLAAPELAKLFRNLRKSVFNNYDSDELLIGELIANVTLRLLKPQCDLDANWEDEDLNKAMIRTVKLIHDRTVTRKSTFTVPAFSYIFILLKLSVKSSYARNHDDLVHDVLQIISEHVKLRSTHDVINHPRYLPIKEIFQLLIETISGTSGRVQSQAEACLLDVATCASGDSGCAKASADELAVLLAALENPAVVVRDAALRGLTIIAPRCLPEVPQQPEFVKTLLKRLYVAKFDDNEENRQLAERLWQLSKLDFDPELYEEILSDIEHPAESVQTAGSKALAQLLADNREKVEKTLKLLLKVYRDRLQMIPAKLDEFGREIEKPIDTWFPRRGVAVALSHLAPLITSDSIGDLVEFFVSSSLSDRNELVRKEMLNAALKIVDLHGKETVSTLWPVFDNFMGKSSKSANFDAVKQAVVILMGSLARHLDKDDPRIKPIVLRLIQALGTPSQTVQEAVGNCLPPLIPSVKEEAPGLINKLLHQLLKGDRYGERKGAAYGLAGLVKGMGILALKQHDIMTKLTEAIQDKKNYKHREGALFAFEMLFHMLGKLFEPYIIHVLPHLLQCFGDTSQYVRAAADDTAKVVMGKLSGHGVKLVLPSLLDALEQDSWRTKTGSVELLGAMAYCAPKQLSSCLPSIVPKLIEVLSDSHMKVQEAGAAALKVIGSVIRNPEIQAIVPVLLRALQDPSNKTSVCLQTLLDTQFVHFIDAPSLALIMPVVQRAFMDRSTETRKMSAQIIGNMYSLTDQKDLLPYLPTIIPGLKQSLLDPVPEVRSVSARALGAMVRGMGEQSFEDLLPWLMQTLTSESSSVDRSGAAQGLSEVVGGLGVEKLHKLMPEIIATAERTDIAPHVKDGYIMMFIYMPGVFTDEFTPYIGQIINPILKALADENEYVRDTALKAGQRIVMLYAESAILLLLPELENGLFDENWRIRYSSVQLLGDLLYRISGVTGKMSTETASEDDNFGTEQSHQAIIRCLGAERRNRVLAGLYMGRSDVALMVRQAALHVWKVVVTNTPRTLREILPTLFGLLLGCLASDSYDKRQVAARTLGDLVRKLGERVLPEIIPILERGLQSDQPDQRQGVCIGLSEIMASTSKDMVLTFVNSLVPTVRKALCDPLPEVRQAAAKTFDSLHSTVGSRALDDILPTLLNQLNTVDDPDMVEWTLDGLRQVMAIKSRVVLPYLVPQLTAPPANTKALSILAAVAGESLNKYLPRILPALQVALATSRNTPEEAQQFEYCQAVVLSVNDDVGIRTVIDTMLENTRSVDADQRRAAATLLCGFCANSKGSYAAHIPQLLRGLIHLCTDEDKDVLQMCWEALNAITKSLEPKQQATYVSDVRQAVRYALSDLRATNNATDSATILLPGFCVPKGIAPILPIFREAILNGDGDEKEQAAQGLGEVIRVTSPQALQPSVVAITGPLIRILGDRFSPNVKTAVLETLAILLAKVGVMLKQFLPQLQTTFIKALNDPNRTVRLKSASALGHLIVIHQRADPLFMELHNTIKNNDDSSIKETTLHALRGIITPAGDKMSDSVKNQIHSTLLPLLGHSDDVTRLCAAGCLGAICRWLSPAQLDVTLMNDLLSSENNNNAQSDWLLKHGRAAAITVALKESPDTLWVDKYKEKLVTRILGFLAYSDKVQVVQCGVRSCGYLLQFLMINQLALPTNLLVPFVRTMNNNSNEVKQLLARVCIHLAKNVPEDKMSTELLKLLLPTLVNGTKEKNGYVKANSELALIEVLRLRSGDAMQQRCLSILDVGARESLSDVVSKVLKKIINQPEGKEEELDDTLLT